MKKRLIVFATVVTLVLLFCFTAQADDGDRKSGLFSYKLKGNGDAIITGFDWDSNGREDIYIPNQIDGYTVSEIGDYAFSSTSAGYPNEEKTDIDNVDWDSLSEEEMNAIIQSMINGTSSDGGEWTIIGQNVAVVLPDTVKVIGEKAFFCTAISAVTIPANVQIIGPGAFAGCPNLRNHAVASGNNTFATINGVLYNKTKKELVSFPSAADTEEFSVPDGIISIGDYAFFGAGLRNNGSGSYVHYTSGGFKKFSLPATVKKIGKYAFAFDYCGNEFNLSGVETIDDYAFYHTHMEIRIPAVKEIGKYSFAFSEGYISFNPSERKAILLPSSVETIGEGSFFGYEIKEGYIDLTNTQIQTIPSSAFQKATTFYGSLYVNLPQTLTKIETSAFMKVGLHGETYEKAKITLPASVKVIGDNAFFAARISQFTFEEGSKLTSIGNSAFGNAFSNSFEGVFILPDGLESIGDEAFVSDVLNKLHIPSSVTKIGNTVCDRGTTQLEVEAGSYAEFYATENGYGYTVAGGDDTSWLND